MLQRESVCAGHGLCYPTLRTKSEEWGTLIYLLFQPSAQERREWTQWVTRRCAQPEFNRMTWPQIRARSVL